MTTSPYALLDQAELMQLAITASQTEHGGAAIGYLKEAVSRPDANAIAHFLLGAEYAQIQMYDRAIGEMEAALALDPSLATARLQLAMLLMGANEAARAVVVLEPLHELGAGHPFALFGRGLDLLARDQLPAASAALAEGIAANTSNLPLNGDMQRIVDQIATLAAADPAAAAPASATDHHIFLSAYTGKGNI